MAFRIDPESNDGLPEPLADINVTPFIDVMLVLLIIFMVTAPMLAAGLPVDLPKASQARPLDSPHAVVVSIAADGTVSVEKTPVPVAELGPLVRARQSGVADPVHIQADRETRYAVLAAALDSLSRVGIARYALVMVQERPE